MHLLEDPVSAVSPQAFQSKGVLAALLKQENIEALVDESFLRSRPGFRDAGRRKNESCQMILDEVVQDVLAIWSRRR